MAKTRGVLLAAALCSWLPRGAGVAALFWVLAPAGAHAFFHLTVIDELMSGLNLDPDVQFVEVRMTSPFQNVVAMTRLTAFNCDFTACQVLMQVPVNVPNQGAGARWLMASPDDATFFAATGTHADFYWDNFTFGDIDPDCGMVCWGAPGIVPADPASWNPGDPNQYVDCVAYGGYTGPTKTSTHDGTPPSGTPTALTAGDDTNSLTRVSATGNNATDFMLRVPTPTNNGAGSPQTQVTTDPGPCVPFGGATTTTTTTTRATTTTSTVAASTTTSSTSTTHTSTTTSSSTTIPAATTTTTTATTVPSATSTTSSSTTSTRATSTTSTSSTSSTATTVPRATTTTTLPVPPGGGRIAGGSGGRADCYSEFDGVTATSLPGAPPRVDCVDGDPCDRDGECGNGFCAFRIRLCVNQNDPNIPVCKPPRSGLRSIHVVPPQFSALAKGMDLRKSSCGDFVDVAVPTHRDGIHPDRPGRVRLRVVARAPGANPPTDGDTLMLVCRPRPANRPCP